MTVQNENRRSRGTEATASEIALWGQQQRETYPTTEGGANAALLAHVRSLTWFEREDLRNDRWGEVRHLCNQYGVNHDAVRSALAATEPKQNADRFEWLEAITRQHSFGVRALRAANAIFSFVGPHGYAWPGQKALARRAGYKDPAEIRRGIASLEAAGALRRLKVVNLPRELADLALSAVVEGGSAGPWPLACPSRFSSEH